MRGHKAACAAPAASSKLLLVRCKSGLALAHNVLGDSKFAIPLAPRRATNESIPQAAWARRRTASRSISAATAAATNTVVVEGLIVVFLAKRLQVAVARRARALNLRPWVLAPRTINAVKRRPRLEATVTRIFVSDAQLTFSAVRFAVAAARLTFAVSRARARA